MTEAREPETVAEGEDGPDGASPATVRVMLLSAALLVLTAVAYFGVVQIVGSLQTPIRVPWIGLVIGFGLAEVFVIHLQFRRDAHSISLNEIPVVLGLFFATPNEMLSAHLIGAALVLAFYRRQPPLKLAFNLSHFALESCVAILVFHLAVGGATGLGPRQWTAALVATLVLDLVSGLVVTLVITLHEGRTHQVRPRSSQLRRVVAASAVTALVNTSLALVGVTALWFDARTAWLLGVVSAVVLLAYRAYASLSDRHASLELLYQFTRAVGRSQKAADVTREVLGQARELLRAELAEITLMPVFDGEGAHRVGLGLDNCVRGLDSGAWSTDDEALARVMDDDGPVVFSRNSRDPAVRRYLLSRGMNDLIVAPLRGDEGIIGTISVANRLGDVSTFDNEDARLFETIANHASVALQNGRLIDRLRHDALHDSLTGLPNRTLFQELVRERIGEARRSGGTVAVMLMDLDRFKDVNDSLGHHIGDVLLQEVGHRLSSILHEDVVIARLGGDEFGVLVSDVASEDDAVQAARLVQSAIERPFLHQELSLEVGATIGIALFPDHGSDAATLLKRADVAMYGAKSGSTRVEVYSAESDQYSPRRLALVGDLRGAIESRSLEVHYQPKADIRTGAIVGVEALVRWQHPEYGSLRPDEFIPLAEHTGLIGPLTIHVLRLALAQCQAWQAEHPGLTVAVNLSTRTLLDIDLPDDVAAILYETRVPAQLLTLEITESSVMSDPARTIAVLDRLRRMGVKLSVDDFGTGYSSLSYLKRLPVDEVKVDKSFVFSMANNESDAAIVRSIVDLGRNLGLEIVAEGVEDVAAWAKLRELGCDVAQGYVLTRPLPATDLSTWLTARRRAGHREASAEHLVLP